MNSIERVVKVLNHEEPDRVPVYPLINSISMKYLGYDYDEWTLDPEKCAASILKATDECDVDVICSLVDLSIEAADWGMKIEYPKDKAAGPGKGDPFISCEDDYDKVNVIDPRTTPRMSNYIKMTKILVDAKGHEKPIVGFVFGPLGILSMLRELDKMLIDTFSCKEKIFKALDNITESLIILCDELIDAGCHAIMFDTLYSSKTIMSEKMWDEFEGPWQQRLAEHVHNRGVMVMIHNCGEGIYVGAQIKRMHPEAISLLYLANDCKSMAEMKEKYGDQTTFIGHIDPGFLMTCTEEELRQQCREQMDAYMKDGGFILATGCEYPAPLDDRFAKIMVDEAKTYGVYKK
ncbi:MAG: uroporphyrinogen decarboxylase family protein [Suipraeoptans sp.]